MNILYLAHRIPYPPNKGDKIRSFNILKYLARDHTLYLSTILEQKSDEKYLTDLKELCKEVYAVQMHKQIRLIKCLFQRNPFSVAYFYHKSLQDFVNKTLKQNKIEAVICICSSMAEYVFRTPVFRENKMNGLKLIIDYIDLDSDKWRQYSQHRGFPFRQIYKIEHRRLAKYEMKINQAFDHSIFVSPQEARNFKSLNSDLKSTIVIPNGVDIEYFKPKVKLPANKNPILLFTGVMDYFANVDGVKWFSQNIFHLIKAEIPGAQFYIVGMRPTKTVRNLAKIEGVHVTGYVQDIRKYYSMADICVVPLRIAQGIQNKVLEAMATGNAVVATSNAARGISCQRNSDILVVDDEQSFVDSTIALLKDDTRRLEMGAKAVETIRRNYVWETNLRKFNQLLQ